MKLLYNRVQCKLHKTLCMKPNRIMNRMSFLRQSFAGAAGIVLFNSGQTIAHQDKAKQEKPAPLNVEIVKEFVGASHGKFDRVKEMLENDHLLLHVSYDWGGGDYESGIEAAGHVGNKEIANYLISKGARYNIYLACMLGHMDTVKQVLTFNPSLLHSKGPHGFTMLHHAQRGGQEATAVVEYLQSLGAKETKIDFYARA
jgi:hypothetical protein